jgi:hypothetical protein
MLVQYRIDETNGSLPNLDPLLNDPIDYASEKRSAGVCAFKSPGMAILVDSNALAVFHDETVSKHRKYARSQSKGNELMETPGNWASAPIRTSIELMYSPW